MEGIENGKWNVGKGKDIHCKKLSESTADPSISMIAEDVPTLTLATILGVAVVIVIAIVVVFVLGVFIDCRQQKMLERKMGQLKRIKSKKNTKVQPLGDVLSIADNMEESGISPAPAEMLSQIP